MKVYFDFFGMNKRDVYCNMDGSLYDNPDGECIIGPEYRNQTLENYQFFNPGDYLVYDDKNVFIYKDMEYDNTLENFILSSYIGEYGNSKDSGFYSIAQNQTYEVNINDLSYIKKLDNKLFINRFKDELKASKIAFNKKLLIVEESEEPDHKIFKAYDKVLVKMQTLNGQQYWMPSIYSFYSTNNNMHYVLDSLCISDEDILPYEENKALAGIKIN